MNPVPKYMLTDEEVKVIDHRMSEVKRQQRQLREILKKSTEKTLRDYFALGEGIGGA